MNIQDYAQLQEGFQQEGNHINFDQENRVRDYSSVKKYVNLPQLRKVQPYENVFPPVQDELKNSDTISSQLKQSMIDVRNKLRNQFTTFEDAKHFKFTFPQSKFPGVQPGTRNMITYAQKNIVEEEDTFRDKLSPEQIQQIKQNGQFKVRSNQEYITLPYIWKVNDTLFKGKQNVELTWYKTIAKAHSNMYNAIQTIKQQIPRELHHIKKIPGRLFSLFFGKKSMKNTYEIDYPNEVAKDFWDQVMTKHYVKSKQWGSDLFQYFNAGYTAQDFITIRQLNEDSLDKEYQKKIKQQQQSRQKYQKKVTQKAGRKQKINQISDEFQRNWIKNKKKVFADVSNAFSKETSQLNQNANESEQLIKKKEKQNEELILQKFNQKKFQCYTSFLQKKLPKIDIPTGVIEAIVTILTLLQISAKKQRSFTRVKQQQRSKVEHKIKNEHKIKQYDPKWYSDELQRLYAPIYKKLNDQYYNKFIDLELIKKLNMKQKQVYNLWLQYRVTYDARIEAKKRQFPALQEPKRIFYSTYKLLPPFKVIKRKNGYNNYYEMIREESMQISTDHNFWKLNLYIMRVKSWTINCVVFLIYSCWKGPFGLRCLWGTTQFKYSQTINYQTGQILNVNRKPLLRVFKDVLEGIQKSRAHFQGLPDRGLFGKNFSRYFNYAQCYIFRFLFVGIFITLILYPLAIVVFSLLAGALIITVWAWMPIILLITYLFNVLLFHFESSYVPYGFFIRAAPIFSVVLNLLFTVLKIILMILIATVIVPIADAFILLYACLARGFRTATDTIMLFLIRKLGRTPSRNTAIAKKISGPGMSKNYYMSINEEDVYILVQSQLEQILMRQYNSIFNIQVNKPIDRFNKTMNLFLQPYTSQNYYYNQNQNVIIQSVNDLRNKYNIEYANYMARYPGQPYNIRFTQEQIDAYFQNTVSIVKNFVQKNKIKSWIFEDYHILQDYEQLTRKIWMTVFSCGEQIFQPLQKIDQRFKLEDMYKNQGYDSQSFGSKKMRKNVNIVMQALNGEVELKPTRGRVNPWKYNLMNRQIDSYGVRQMFSVMECNSEGRVYFSLDVPRFQFFANLSIKEIIKKDAHQYQWRKQENQKNKLKK